jgi:hypothetical protein
MKKFNEFKESLTEARNYKYSPSGSHKVKATVCYIDPMSRMRKCDDIWFKSKMDALGFKDNVKGFPKGAEVEAIKESDEANEETNTSAVAGADSSTVVVKKKKDVKTMDR